MQEAVARPFDELRCAEPTAAVSEALRHLHELYRYHTGTQLRALHFARVQALGN